MNGGVLTTAVQEEIKECQKADKDMRAALAAKRRFIPRVKSVMLKHLLDSVGADGEIKAFARSGKKSFKSARMDRWCASGSTARPSFCS